MESFFKTFDVRGKYPDEIDEKVASKIAFCAGQLIKGRIAVVGVDFRQNSRSLIEPVIFGLQQAGKKVVFLDQVPTELFYFSVGYGEFDLGVQLTASHCPFDEVGMKLVSKGVIPFAGTPLYAELRRLFRKNHSVFKLTYA